MLKKLLTITTIALLASAGATFGEEKKKDAGPCNPNRFKSTVKYGGPRGFKLVKFIALNGASHSESASLEGGKTYNVYTLSSGGARKGITVQVKDPKGGVVATSSKSPGDSNLEFTSSGGDYTIMFTLDGSSKNCGGAGLMVK